MRWSCRLITTLLPLIFVASHSVAQPADSLLLSSADHTPLNTASLRGKVVFMNFWATSCIPCKEEMPALNRLYLHFKDSANIVFLSIDVDANSAAFMKEHNYTIPVYFISGQVPEKYFRGVLPTTLIINRSGRITTYHEGEDDYDNQSYIDLLTRLITE